MTIILFLVVLAVLIFVHELGHFIAAKKMGIRVDEFALGFPPRIFGKRYGETVYTLNAIPFGGFVRIFGENPNEESMNGADASRSFVNKPGWAQAIVLVAGVAFNFIFAWLLIVIAFSFGVAASYSDYPAYTAYMSEPQLMVTSVAHNSPAYVAGIKAGSIIDSIEVVQIAGQKNAAVPQVIHGRDLTPEVVQSVVKGSEGRAVKIVYNCDEAKSKCSEVEITPTNTLVPNTYVIGISMDRTATMSLPVHYALLEGTRFAGNMIWNTATGLITFFGTIFKGTAELSQVSGPIGIAGLVGDASRLGITYLLMFTAMISVNLGVINLMPFPALDGGRLLFVLIEGIIRKKIKPIVANTLNTVGFALLLILMLVVTYGDIVRLWFTK